MRCSLPVHGNRELTLLTLPYRDMHYICWVTRQPKPNQKANHHQGNQFAGAQLRTMPWLLLSSYGDTLQRPQGSVRDLPECCVRHVHCSNFKCLHGFGGSSRIQYICDFRLSQIP
jgi:hypothetical protein